MLSQSDPQSAPRVVDRVPDGPHGELVLRRVGDDYEIISNGVFLMDTRNGESERLLLSAACDRVAGDVDVLVGGLGVGFTLAEALSRSDVAAVTVVEFLAPVIAWHEGPLRPFSAGGLEDPRVQLVRADLQDWLPDCGRSFDVVCLDVDNGPDWTVVPDNAALYDDAGIDVAASRLRPGGVLAVWSAASHLDFARRLRRRFDEVVVLDVPVPRGEPDVVYLAVGPR